MDGTHATIRVHSSLRLVDARVRILSYDPPFAYGRQALVQLPSGRTMRVGVHELRNVNDSPDLVQASITEALCQSAARKEQQCR